MAWFEWVIAESPNYDLIFLKGDILNLGDYSRSVGWPGRFEQPEFMSVRDCLCGRAAGQRRQQFQSGW